MEIDELVNVVKKNGGIGIFPSRTTWGEIYGKYRKMLISSLSSWYCYADREDAVENAFYKLMNKKDPAAYGEKMPASTEEWVTTLYWQARSNLSHMKEHSQVHAKYIEKMSKELEDVFVSGNQGVSLDAAVISRAMSLALELFKEDQDVKARDLKVFIAATRKEMSTKYLAKKHKITESNVYTIKCRIGELLAKYGRKYFQAALKKVA